MSESMLNKDLEKFIIDSGLEDVLLSIKSLKDEFSSLFTEFEKEFKELDENQEVVKIGDKEFLVAGENPDGTPILKEKKNGNYNVIKIDPNYVPDLKEIKEVYKDYSKIAGAIAIENVRKVIDGK